MTKTATKKPAAKKAPPRDPGALTVHQHKDEEEVEAMARVLTSPTLTAATTLRDFGKGIAGDKLDLNACMDVLDSYTKAVHGGSLKSAETMLTTQAMSLNMIFTELARRAALNMGEYPDAFERYMRLALKAQGQCRATLETLAAIKNPPVVYAKQANINNGGQQQVNNGTAPPESLPAPSASLATIEGGGGIESLQAPSVETTRHPTQGKNPPLKQQIKR